MLRLLSGTLYTVLVDLWSPNEYLPSFIKLWSSRITRSITIHGEESPSEQTSEHNDTSQLIVNLKD